MSKSKSEKKTIRQAFRDTVFLRAGYRCQGPGCRFVSSKQNAESDLDSHHIYPRTTFTHGGYIPQNGIALCSSCHVKAEEFYRIGKAEPGFSPEELIKIIGSTKELAYSVDSDLYPTMTHRK